MLVVKTDVQRKFYELLLRLPRKKQKAVLDYILELLRTLESVEDYNDFLKGEEECLRVSMNG